MTAPNLSPCDAWATMADLCSPCDDYDFPDIEDALDLASGLLYRWSGQRFPGVCTKTIRPCTRARSEQRYVSDEATVVVCGCTSSDSCSCNSIPQIQLSSWPLLSVTEVKVDGSVLDSSRYRIDDHRWLVRLDDADGTNPGWPCCQDMLEPTTAEDTFSVSFTHGVEPPPEGVRAAAVLGCELALACSPETASKCRLPKRTTQVVRAGVTLSLIDPTELFQWKPGQGPPRTGLMEVDVFLSAYNPYGVSAPAAVHSPDIPPFGRRTST